LRDSGFPGDAVHRYNQEEENHGGEELRKDPVPILETTIKGKGQDENGYIYWPKQLATRVQDGESFDQSVVETEIEPSGIKPEESEVVIEKGPAGKEDVD
jgi:hypothetical protein